MNLILTNTRLFVVGACPEKGLVALRGDRIAAVTSSDRLPELRRPRTRVIDCGGGALLPGFHDAHLHLFSMVRRELGVDLGPAEVNSIDDVIGLLRWKADATPYGEWISGHGYDDFYLGRHLTRHDLDAATTRHPVVAAHRSLHACVLNSRALELASINETSEELPGTTIDREAETGLPSGLLYEMLGWVRQAVMPPPDAAEIRRGLHQVDRDLISRGVTSVQDATISNGPARYHELRGYVDRGDLNIRLMLLLGGPQLDDFMAQGLDYRHGDYRLRLGHVKLMLNLIDGKLQPVEDELTAQIISAQRAGFPVAIHAIEEAAVAAAVGAIVRARKQTPAPFRHRIEHAAECPPELLPQISAAGITVVSQPSFLYHSGQRYLATVVEQKHPYLYPCRSWLEAGIPVAASSDSPVVPVDPLTGIAAAVTRRSRHGELLNPAERIPVASALQLFTHGAAYAAGEEHNKGSLVPGQLADLVLLAADPRDVPPESIPEIKVLLTVIGGKVVWEA